MKKMPNICIRGLHPTVDIVEGFTHYLTWVWMSGKFKDIKNVIGITKYKNGRYLVYHNVDDPDGVKSKQEQKGFLRYEDAVKYLRKFGKRINKKYFQDYEKCIF